MSGIASDIRGWCNSALADLENAIHDAEQRAKESGQQEDTSTVAQLAVARDALVRARDSVREDKDWR